MGDYTMLRGKVVLITGASSGLGALLAREVAAKGAITILTGRNEERLQQVAASVSGNASYKIMDVRKDEDVLACVSEIEKDYGRLDILINNAGYGIFSSIEEMDMAQYHNMIDTNYLGAVRCTKAVLPIMNRQKNGHIVNIASMAGKIATAKSTSYSATKHALLGFTDSLRMELRGSGIKVSSVNPGPIETEFFQLADPEGSYLKNIKWLMMKPEYVVHKIMKLLHTQKAELNLPPLAAAGIKLYSLCPRLIDSIAGKWLNQK